MFVFKTSKFFFKNNLHCILLRIHSFFAKIFILYCFGHVSPHSTNPHYKPSVSQHVVTTFSGPKMKRGVFPCNEKLGINTTGMVRFTGKNYSFAVVAKL